MRSVHEHQTRNERRGKDRLLKKQCQENWPRALKNITGHPLDHLKEIYLKTRRFAHGALPPRPESSEMALQSALSWTQGTSALSSFSPLAAPPCWGTEASLLLSAWTQPRYPEARALTALRRESSRQLATEPSLRAKRPVPAGQGETRGEERAAPRSHSPEGSPRSSSAGALRLEAQTQMEQNSSTTLLKTR